MNRALVKARGRQFVCTVYRQDDANDAGGGSGGGDPRDIWYRVDDVEKAVGVDTIAPAMTRRTWADLVRRYNATLHGLSYHVRDHQVFAPTMFVSAAELEARCAGLRLEIISPAARTPR